MLRFPSALGPISILPWCQPIIFPWYNNSAVFEDYEPGSIFKVFTIAAGIDQGKIKPESTYIDKGSIMIEGWHKPIKNSDFETHGAYGRVDKIITIQ